MPNPDGGWDVRAPNAVRRSSHSETKEGAITRARQILANAGGGEMFIHSRDGRIQDSTTVQRVGRITADVRSALSADGFASRESVPSLTERSSTANAVDRYTTTSRDEVTRHGDVWVDGVLIRGLSKDDAVTAIKLLRAARDMQFTTGQSAAHGLLSTMLRAEVELIPPASVEQARRLAGVRKALLATPVLTHETLGEVRGDSNPSTTRTWVSRARERGRLFTVKVDGRSVIPALQLTDSGDLRDEYAPVLSPLLEADLDGWAIWIWLTTPSPLLSGGIPDRLITETPERVRRAAQRFAASQRSAA